MKREIFNNINEEMADIFYNFNLDDFKDRQGKKIIETISGKNKTLKKEIEKAKATIYRLEEKLKRKRVVTYEDTFKKVESKHYYLNENSIRSLATAEYMFINEKAPIDYTGVYLNYTKAFEMEIKRYFGRNQKLTLGQLLLKLKNIPELKTFVESLEKIKLIEKRNYGVHNGGISKNECGKLRDVLIVNGWLDRACYILENIKSSKIKECNYKIFIEENQGIEIYNGTTYQCFSTDSEYILSKKNLKYGWAKGVGRRVEIRGIEYIII